jgi:hypothetical protein
VKVAAKAVAAATAAATDPVLGLTIQPHMTKALHCRALSFLVSSVARPGQECDPVHWESSGMQGA